ncbi:MAG: alanine--glyoxylate aminotransferase family protein [Dethiobacteria bacterium]
MKKEYLMIPGPTPIPREVSQALGAEIFNHRGSKFKTLIEEVTVKLKKIFETNNDLFILTSSGTGAMEAGIVNFISPGEQVLCLSNGAFGDRLAAISKIYGIEVVGINSEWGKPLKYDVLVQKLAADTARKIKAIMMVHNESSTGIMNDVEKVSKIRGDHPALLITDTVSSLGAVHLPVDEWKIDICFTGSQKALLSPPGLAFISVSPQAWAAQKNKTGCYYFNLRKAKEYLEIGQTPFTPAILQVEALNTALDMLLEEDRCRIYERHLRMMRAIRNAVKALRMDILVSNEDDASRTVTAVKAPRNLDVKNLRLLLNRKYGVDIAGGQGKMANEIFRIGHLGAISELDIITTIAALEMSLLELGYNLELGSGVSEAQKVIMNM